MDAEAKPETKYNFKYRGLFLGAFVLLYIIIFSICRNSSEFINFWLPICCIVSLGMMYSLNKIHHLKMYKPIGYLFPLYISLSMSFGIISILFGIHTDIFVSYDKNEMNNSDRFKWFKAKEILQFPIEQINSISNIPVADFNYQLLKDTNTVCHFIIIDKTLSVSRGDNRIDSFLTKKIFDNFYVDPVRLKDAETSDLIPPFIFSGLYDNLQDYCNEFVSLLYYTGESNLLFLGNNNDSYGTYIKTELSNPNSSFINNYFDRMRDYNKIYKARNQRTELNDIIASLESIMDLGAFEKYGFFKVTVISDFLNSDSTSKLKDFHSIPKISQLNLYCTNGFDSRNPKCSSFEVIDQLTIKYSYLKPKMVIDLKNNFETERFFNDISLSNSQYFDHKVNRSINFFYPYRDYNTSQEAISRIVFTGESSQDQIKTKSDGLYFFKIRDLGKLESNFPIFYETKGMEERDIAYSEDLVPIKIVPNDTLTLYLPNALNIVDDHGLFIEISSFKSNKTETRALAFKPRMPDTTSYYLLFFYYVLLLSLSLILILPNLFILRLVFHNRIRENSSGQSIANLVSLSFPIFLGGFLMVYFYHSLAKINFLPIWFYLVPLLVLLGFSVPVFLSNYSDYYNGASETERIDRPYTFHMFGSIWRDLLVFINGKN